MSSKILNTLNLANAFKSILFKRITSPCQSKNFLKLIKDIKACFEKEKDKAQAAIKALDLLIAFKKEYPKDYEEIFIILDELLKIYEENPKVKENLKELFGS